MESWRKFIKENEDMSGLDSEYPTEEYSEDHLESELGLDHEEDPQVSASYSDVENEEEGKYYDPDLPKPSGPPMDVEEDDDLIMADDIHTDYQSGEEANYNDEESESIHFDQDDQEFNY